MVQEHHRCGLFNLPHCVTILIRVTIKYAFVFCCLWGVFSVLLDYLYLSSGIHILALKRSGYSNENARSCQVITWHELQFGEAVPVSVVS